MEKINEIRAWDEEKLKKYPTEYLEGFDNGIESLKTLFLNNQSLKKAWHEAKELSNRIKHEIERRTEDESK